MEIRPARWPEDLARTRELFREYEGSLTIDLSFQEFEREFEGLPGAYAPPGGALLVAVDGAATAGCVAMRPHGPGICEMKRLFVRPAYRGSGLGRRLVDAIVEEGRARGYVRMRLDTIPELGAAIALYRAYGFREIPPYTPNPEPGALFMEMEL